VESVGDGRASGAEWTCPQPTVIGNQTAHPIVVQPTGTIDPCDGPHTRGLFGRLLVMPRLPARHVPAARRSMSR
jgi:hypothetical protein